MTAFLSDAAVIAIIIVATFAIVGLADERARTRRRRWQADALTHKEYDDE